MGKLPLFTKMNKELFGLEVPMELQQFLKEKSIISGMVNPIKTLEQSEIFLKSTISFSVLPTEDYLFLRMVTSRDLEAFSKKPFHLKKTAIIICGLGLTKVFSGVMEKK
jgi:hypothetical protein